MTTRTYGGYAFDASNEDKVLFPDSGVTKGDLIDHYEGVAEHILPHMKGRPVSMHRFPDGIESKGFYHKETPEHFPEWITTETVGKKQGGSSELIIADKTATLAYLADQACITPHVWLSRADRIDQPDRIVIDLDPSDDDFDKVRQAARICADALEEMGLAVFLQLTGSRGIHVVSPISRRPDFDEVRGLARSVAGRLAEDHPDELTVEQRKDKRGKRIYLDTGRIAYGQTMVTPYAVRARPGAPVATPIERDELSDSKLDPRKYTVKNIRQRLSRKGDPWSAINRSARSIQHLRKAVGG